MMAEPLPKTLAVLDTVLTGCIRPLGDGAIVSAIDKKPGEGEIHIGFEGLTGDEQADRKHHGGREKAVHHYPFEHYSAWRQRLPASGLFDRPGAFGENFSTLGMTEETLCVGDVLRVGSALLQVSQGRQPCRTLNARFQRPSMAREVQETGRTGWYYRVLEEGAVRTGDAMVLVERPHSAWTLARVQNVICQGVLDKEILETLSTLPLLASSWQALFAQRLRCGEVEGWRARLGA